MTSKCINLKCLLSNFVPVIMKCENLIPPKNGFLQYTHSLDEGSIVTYSCIKGYEIRQRGSTRKVRVQKTHTVSYDNISSVFAAVMDVNGQRKLEFVTKEQCQMDLHQLLLLPTNKTKNHDEKKENKNDKSKLLAKILPRTF